MTEEMLSLPVGLKFGPFPVTSSQAFHISPSRLSFALVNLKPLLPGHTLVCPVRVVSRLQQLSAAETSDLFATVQRVSRMLERVHAADSFNIAVQDGVEAGQSVPHVHVHVIPRKKRDMDEKGGGDRLYEMMDGSEGNVGGALWDQFRMMQARRVSREQQDQGEIQGGPITKRVARTEEEMKREADRYRTEMAQDNR